MEQLCGIEKKLAQVSNTDEEEWDQLIMQAEAVKVRCLPLLYIPCQL